MEKAQKRLKHATSLDEEIKGKIFPKLSKINFDFNLDPSSDRDQEEDETAARGDTDVHGFVTAENFAFIYGCAQDMGVLANTTMIKDLSDVLKN